MKAATPKRLEVDRDQLRELVLQTRRRLLNDGEFETLQATTETLIWLSDELKLRNKRLYRMLFGPSSEKTKDVVGEQSDGEPAEDDGDSDDEPAGADDACSSPAGSTREKT